MTSLSIKVKARGAAIKAKPNPVRPWTNAAIKTIALNKTVSTV